MDPYAVTSRKGGKFSMAHIFPDTVRATATAWSHEDGHLSDEHRALRNELLTSHRLLCKDPSSPEAQQRFATADSKFWQEDERLAEEFKDDGFDDDELDPSLRGFHEGWVWDFRYTHPDDYEDLLMKRKGEYMEAKAAFEAAPWDPELGLSMDRTERARKETAYLIYLAYTDQKALIAMFAPGDEYAAAEEAELEKMDTEEGDTS